MKQKHGKLLLAVIGCSFVFIGSSAFADCVAATTLPNTPQIFYDHNLGNYTIYLQPTLTDIKNHTVTHDEFQKQWTGVCPAGMGDQGTCIEFTVYPATPTNFIKDASKQLDIMPAIEQYTDGKENRGMVRIVTNADETQYVYTTDHEQTFCGPYGVS